KTPPSSLPSSSESPSASTPFNRSSYSSTSPSRPKLTATPCSCNRRLIFPPCFGPWHGQDSLSWPFGEASAQPGLPPRTVLVTNREINKKSPRPYFRSG